MFRSLMIISLFGLLGSLQVGLADSKKRSDLFNKKTQDKVNSFYTKLANMREPKLDKSGSELLKRILSETTPKDLAEAGRPDLLKISTIIVMLRKEEMVKWYVDFILKTRESSDEVRSFGLALLYTELTPQVLKAISKLSKKDRKEVEKAIVWGAVNNFYPLVTFKNVRKKIVGPNWGVYSKKRAHSSIAERIAEEAKLTLRDVRR